MADRTLSDLVQRAEQLSSNIDEGGEELPRVDRSLYQILQSAQKDFPASATPSGNHDAQASILLGSRGVDIMHIGHQLEALDSARTLEPLTPAPDTDIAAFLRNEQQNAITSVVVATKRQTDAQVQNLFWEQEKANWEQTKQRIMAAFTNVNTENLNITMQPQESLLSSLALTAKGLSSLGIEETCYAKVITEYNIEVLNGGIRPNLSECLSRAACSQGDQGITDLWSLVCSITEVPISIGSDSKARCSHLAQAALVKQAKLHLEKSYDRHMRSLVYSQLERANLGGIPGVVPLVRAYLSVVLPPQAQAHMEDGDVNGVPVWPLIFYCLRAGGAKAAAMIAQENSNQSVIDILPALEQLEKSDTGRISSELEKKLRLSYKRCSKNITDPFKRVVYCVLAHVDVEGDHSDIIVTTDDYLWLKLSLVDPQITPSPVAITSKGKTDCLSLCQLQNLLYVQFGENHFNAFTQPLLYSSVLLLTGQFEAAIEFLSRIERLRTHAMHVALALQEMNLLALSSNPNAPLLCTEEGDPEGLRRINLVQLIRLYINKFEITNPLEALHYCFFLRNLEGENMTVFNECICNLILESRDFDILLGVLNTDSTRTPGIIDKLKVDVSEIAEFVANDSEKKGLHEDAVKLYDLAKNHEKTLMLLNTLLSQVVPTKAASDRLSSHGSKRLRVVDMASAVGQRYRVHGHNATPHTIATLYLLLDIATFFDLYHQERFTEAMDILKPLKIVALLRDEVDAFVNGLTSLGLEVKSVLPHILVAAMTSTYRLYQTPQISAANSSLDQSSLLSSPLGKSGLSVFNMSSQVLPATKFLKEQARAIVTFAGMIPLRLNADVNARLVQLEALIN